MFYSVVALAIMKDKKTSSIFKSLAIVGFGAIIILISWLSIQMVNLMPNAFNSLASLSNTLNEETGEIISQNDEPDNISIVSSSNVINSNEAVDLTWDPNDARGTYTFSFECEDGVSLSTIDESTGIRAISCDTSYNIGDVSSLTLVAESEKDRFSNIKYTIGFLATNDTEPRAIGNSSFTVVNTLVNDIAIEDNEETEELVVEVTEDDSELTVAEEESEVNSNPSNPTQDTTPTTPTFEQEFVYTIPTSDPSGRTDLSTRYLFAGEISGNRFIPGAIQQNNDGAIQFEVKNFGTKTSEEWTYSMTLPNGGSFDSEEQNPLKPNERAVITLGFPTDDSNNFTFEVNIDEDTDRNSTNNEFEQRVIFVD